MELHLCLDVVKNDAEVDLVFLQPGAPRKLRARCLQENPHVCHRKRSLWRLAPLSEPRSTPRRYALGCVFVPTHAVRFVGEDHRIIGAQTASEKRLWVREMCFGEGWDWRDRRRNEQDRVSRLWRKIGQRLQWVVLTSNHIMSPADAVAVPTAQVAL